MSVHLVRELIEKYPESLWAGGALLLVIVGSFWTLPCGTRRFIVQESHLFGLVKRSKRIAYVSLNVGGALIPVGFALFLLRSVPLEKTGIAIGLTALVVRLLSRYVPNQGVAIRSPFPFLPPSLFPALSAAILGFMLDTHAAARIAFVAGSLGVLIGADLIRIPWLWLFRREEPLIIGGAGVHDAILVTACLAFLIVLLQCIMKL